MPGLDPGIHLFAMDRRLKSGDDEKRGHPMCGDLEEDGPSDVEARLHKRFIDHARNMLAQYAKAPKPENDKDLHAYMDKLFSDALSRAARDSDGADDSYARLASQPLVFARLAGFLAAHMSLQEDPLRKVIEALMHGYSEAEHIEPDHHGHDHHHDHEHGHDHHHGHAHHHGHEH